MNSSMSISKGQLSFNNLEPKLVRKTWYGHAYKKKMKLVARRRKRRSHGRFMDEVEEDVHRIGV